MLIGGREHKLKSWMGETNGYKELLSIEFYQDYGVLVSDFYGKNYNHGSQFLFMSRQSGETGNAFYNDA